MTPANLASSATNSFWNDTGKSGILAWIFSTDHKRIGLLYLYSVLSFFLVGVLLGLLIRLELMAPGRTIIVQTDTRLSDEEARDCGAHATHVWSFLQYLMRWPRLEPLADTVYLRVVDKVMLDGRPVLGLASGGTGIVIGYPHVLTPMSAATLAHELLHVQDTRELNGRTIPQYFSEGRATSASFAFLRHIGQPDNQDWQRRLMRWNVDSARQVLAGRTKDHSVENEEIGMLFVEQLRQRYKEFFPRSAQVIDRVANGADFTEAFEQVYALRLDLAKAEFLRFIGDTQHDPAARARGMSVADR